MEISSKSVLVVIPTFKECDNLRVIVPELLDRVQGIHILIVDDISHDGTAELILELQKTFGQAVSLISRQNDPSYAKSLLQGLKLGIAKGYSTLVQMDADGSHAPKDLIKLLSAEGDVVIGSRYLRNSNVINVPILRQIYSIAGNAYISLIWKSRLRDKTNGFRLFRSQALDILADFNVSSLGFAVQIQTLRSLCKDRKIQITEVPVDFVFRQIGNSKFDMKKLFEALIIATKSK
jgi:dolichol-phosphate mannosyltransferase